MLEIRNVSKAYHIGKSRKYPVLRDISFKFGDLGLYFIVGSSGSGKSTLLNLIAGFTKCDSGEILLNNKCISKLKDKEIETYLRTDLGIIFQKYNLIDGLTVKDNLEIAKDLKNNVDEDYVNYLLEKFNFINKLNQKVDSLSGGEKQRVAIIRAIMNHPKVLLCDEPTGALDENNSVILFKILEELSKDILIICVTHNTKLIEQFKNFGVVELEDGVIKRKEIVLNTCGILADKKLKKNRLKSNKMIDIITKKNIKNNAKLNLISLFSSIIVVLFMILSLNFETSLSGAKEQIINGFLNSRIYTITKEVETEIDDSLISIVKSERPKRSDVYNLLSDKKITILDSYGYFLNGEKSLYVNNIKYADFVIKPIISSENMCFFNDVFAKTIFNSLEQESTHLIAKIDIKSSLVLFDENKNENVTENLHFSFNFDVGSIKKEFKYMNENVIYVPYNKIEETIGGKVILNKTIKTWVEEAKNDDPITNYEFILYPLNDEANLFLRNFDEKNINYQIKNERVFMVESFYTLSKTLFIGLRIFLVLSLGVSIFISSFLGYASLVQNKRTSAILESLGASKKYIIDIHLNEQMLFVVIGTIIASLLAFVSSYFLNILLADFLAVENALNVVSIKSVLIISGILIINYFVILTPLSLKKKHQIDTELREE